MCMGIGKREGRGKERKERGREEREKREDNTQGFAINPIYLPGPPVFPFIICAIPLPTRTNAAQRITAHLGAYPPVYSP